MTTEDRFYSFSPEVIRAKSLGQPIVALESTVLTHGLPSPQNRELAVDMETAVRENGATPATIALLDGKVRVGMSSEEVDRLIAADAPIKVSLRDFSTCLTLGKPGGTTVAGTMFAASQVGINVFATGGIGGVHKEAKLDISTDLLALSNLPVLVVCAGAKSILDLPATLEYLETMGVPVIGYQTDIFPEFYSRGSGLRVGLRLDSVEEIARFARNHWALGLRSGILITQPVEAAFQLDDAEMLPILDKVSAEVVAMQKERRITGKEVTPYELMRVNELTQGRSLRTNMAFLKNNAVLAAKISKSISDLESKKLQRA